MPFVPDSQQTSGHFVPDNTTLDAQERPAGSNTFGSVIEPAMAMGSSMLAGPASDVAGLADIPAHFLGMSKTMPEDVKRKVQAALTYQPRTTMGQQVTQYNPLTLLGKGINAIGSKANELVAPPMTSGPLRSAAGNAAQAGINALPMLLGGGAPKAGEALASGMKGSAINWMKSALKPSAKMGEKGTEAAKTLLDEGINVTPGGVEKLHDLIDDRNSRISQLIANSPERINKAHVAARLHDVLNEFEDQVAPQTDLKKIQDSWDSFMTHPLIPERDMSVQTAQKLKQGTYKRLKGKYGQLEDADVESQKGLARGLKEEIAKAVPQVRPLNAQESRFLTALSPLERRVLHSANKNPMGLSWLASSPTKMLGFMADRSELFKSLIARMLNAGAKGMPSMNIAGPIGGVAITTQANQIPPPPQ